MDEFERHMCRAKARRRSKLQGTEPLWSFGEWDRGQTEKHHISRWKYGDTLIDVPIPMHRELTRRQMEEHPPEGTDLANPVEREGRYYLGLADILECLADLLRFIGEMLITANDETGAEAGESAYVPSMGGSLLLSVGHLLSAVAEGGTFKE